MKPPPGTETDAQTVDTAAPEVELDYAKATDFSSFQEIQANRNKAASDGVELPAVPGGVGVAEATAPDAEVAVEESTEVEVDAQQTADAEADTAAAAAAAKAKKPGDDEQQDASLISRFGETVIEFEPTEVQVPDNLPVDATGLTKPEKPTNEDGEKDQDDFTQELARFEIENREYETAMAKRRTDSSERYVQRQQGRQRREAQIDAHFKRMAKHVEESPDLSTFVKDNQAALENTPLTDPMLEALAHMPNGVKVQEHLMRNGAEATAIAKMIPVQQVSAIGALAAQIETPAQPRPKPSPKVTATPAPSRRRVRSSRGVAAINPQADNFKHYYAQQNVLRKSKGMPPLRSL